MARRQREWIFRWDKDPSDGPFEFDERFAEYYDFSSRDVLLYDDLAPEGRIATSAQE